MKTFIKQTLGFYIYIALLACVCSCSDSSLSPVIKEVVPNKGIPGTIVTLKGDNFNSIYHQNKITVGGGSTKILSATDSIIRFVLLRDIATGPIILTDLSTSEGDTTTVDFNREGSTLQASPLQDSDAELFQGLMEISNKKYDMNAQGTNQPILIILAQPSDISDPNSTMYFDNTIAATGRDYIVQRASQANTYFQEASYGKTSANFVVTPDWVSLSQVRDFYMWQSEDITRAQTALDGAQAELDALMLNPATTQAQIDEANEKIEQKETELKNAQDSQGFVQEPEFYYAEALLGAKAMLPNFDDFGDYIVVCAGPFLRGSCCWKEEGFHAESTVLGLNFDIDFNAQKGLTYMAQGTHWGRIGHELSHFFAGGDLYPSGTTAGTASGYAFMGNHDSGPLYIGYNMEKRLQYFHNNNIAKETWGSSPTFNQTYDIVAHGNSEDNTGDNVFNLLSLQVTDGMYYHVEVRQKPNPSAGAPNDYIFDQNINVGSTAPAWEGGVIVTSSIEENNQNNNQERNIQLLPPRRILQVGDQVNDPKRTIRISIEQKLADRPLKYRVRLEWGTLPAADPDGQFDLRITPWSPPPWESEDIWANSLKNDETSPPKIVYKNHEPGDDTKPIGNGDEPWVGNNNTLYARIFNNGSVPTPEDVKVTFYINSPPGVGDDGNWTPFDEVNVGILPANSEIIVEANRKWVPSQGEHTCVKVLIQPQTGEITFNNNQAQENFVEFEAASGSPFTPTEFQVDVRNPYDRPVVMDMKVRDVPRFWNAAIEHGSIYLQPKEVRRMNVVIWSDLDGSVLDNIDEQEERKYNRKPLISIEGWVDKIGHSFFPVGGMTAFVQSVQASEINVDPYYESPNISGRGSITPNKEGVPVAIHAISPDGTRHSVTATTKSSGSFIFDISNNSGKPFDPGEYKIIAYILSGSTLASATSPVVPIIVQ
ncbi:IPT/TIG domain-containing protein [Aquimarina sp. Aq78]|uniref:IPT/TIG domain-containing protein n=1 Tax=Aquimarina sp. Aq78 TaxID=1191889 RepID=UPI000D10F2BD|nr:IPT/TIG domain-containing protein [Aquimarina sp. Aq78]